LVQLNEEIDFLLDEMTCQLADPSSGCANLAEVSCVCTYSR